MIQTREKRNPCSLKHTTNSNKENCLRHRTRMHILLITFVFLVLFVSYSPAFYISHSFKFPFIPFSAAVYHIHSPAYFMEAHGFALPGFKIVETNAPKSMGDYVTTEFVYTTYFGTMSAKLFSSQLNTSHVLLMDSNRVPCILGKLTIRKYSTHGHIVCCHADLLRPSNIWERLFGGKRLVKEAEIEKSIKLGYSNLKSDYYLRKYFDLVLRFPKND